MSRTFTRFMVADDIGTNRKLRRLPVAHRWVYVAGVLALAAQSPIRGALLIADGEPATDADVAMQATVPVKDARAALASLRALGMLDRDEDGVEWVHDWDSMNKDPKPSDAPDATRDRKRRQRAKSRATNGGVTRDTPGASRGSHAPEVEVEEEEENNTPLTPQGGNLPVPVRPFGKRASDLREFRAACDTYAAAELPQWPDAGQWVAAAIGAGHVSRDSITAYVEKWSPGLRVVEEAS